MKIVTQREKILALLRTAGPAGINSFDLTYKHRIKQAPMRIHELKKAGYQIVKKDHKNRSAT